MPDGFVEIKREDISDDLRYAIFERDGYQCRYCGREEPPFHIDHVYPVIKGGETSYNNLVTACVKCNLEKHDKVGIWPKSIEYWKERGKPHTSVINVFVLSSALACIAQGFFGKYQSPLVSSSFILAGLLIGLIDLALVTLEKI